MNFARSCGKKRHAFLYAPSENKNAIELSIFQRSIRFGVFLQLLENVPILFIRGR